MMKILWLSNVMVPIACKELGISTTILGGWMDDLACRIANQHNVVFIAPRKEGNIETHNKNITCYGFKSGSDTWFEKILRIEKPDVIHIWGTEFQHSLMMINACQKCGLLDKTVVSIQGLVHLIAEYHYYAGLPSNVIFFNTLHDFLLHNSIYHQRKKFQNRGRYEIETLKKAKHIIGRTGWDYRSVEIVNPNVHYYHCNESLRSPFYEKSWDITKCNSKQIFMSQGHYPLKGLHMVLHALNYVRQVFPDIKLITICKDVNKQSFFRVTAYQAYIRKLIKKYNLSNNVVFEPQKNAEEMSDMICNSRIFVNASSVENSSNSLGEAMLIGCPCIASNVGGTSSFITDGEEGFLYPFNEPYMLASRIIQLLNDDDLCLKMSNQSRIKASEIYDREKNYYSIMNVYNKL